MNDWFDAEHHVERAHDLYEAGKWEEAESELRRALSLNPYRAEWHFNLGLTLEAAGRIEDAVDAFQEAQALEPTDFQTLLLLGASSLRLDRPDEAINWLGRAEQIDSLRIETYIYRIEAFSRLGDHEQAESMFYQALEYEGDHALAYANIAESLLDRREYQRAIYCLRQSISIDPLLPRVYARLATAYAVTGRHERARQLYLRELRDAPGDIDALLDLGCLLVEMNRLAEAGEKFRRVLEIESDHPEAHFHLGDLALKQHRDKEATAAFRLVLRLDPQHPEVRRRLALICVRRGDVGEARKLLRRELRQLAEATDDYQSEDLVELGELLLDVRLPRDAIRVLEKLRERRPDDAQSHHLLAVAHFRGGDRARGLEASRRALRLDPKLLSALHNMALACIHERQWGKSRYYLDQALAIEPEDHALRRLRLTLRVQRLAESVAMLGKRRRLAERRRRRDATR